LANATPHHTFLVGRIEMTARAGLPVASLILVAVLVYTCISTINGDEQQIRREQSVDDEQGARRLKGAPPNIIIFLVDDLGWNQVGYHAAPSGNNEVKTPHIDHYATTGIELDRGSMTPWYVALVSRHTNAYYSSNLPVMRHRCGPSRAALITGRTNSYNGNVSVSCCCRIAVLLEVLLFAHLLIHPSPVSSRVLADTDQRIRRRHWIRCWTSAWNKDRRACL
jgi:hypothetical protein